MPACREKNVSKSTILINISFVQERDNSILKTKCLRLRVSVGGWVGWAPDIWLNIIRDPRKPSFLTAIIKWLLATADTKSYMYAESINCITKINIAWPCKFKLKVTQNLKSYISQMSCIRPHITFKNQEDVIYDWLYLAVRFEKASQCQLYLKNVYIRLQ